LKAVVYQKPYELELADVPEPDLTAAHEVILRVTSTAICGSDLHLFHGLVQHTPHGQILGHEFMGIVEEVGKRQKNGAAAPPPRAFPNPCAIAVFPPAVVPCLNSNCHGDFGATFGYGSYGGHPRRPGEIRPRAFADVSPIAVPES
jgi:S-(hydroxymethyl)glutathione dehydrogenase/alcohol dehydrogenase